jgi:hypothetical protein
LWYSIILTKWLYFPPSNMVTWKNELLIYILEGKKQMCIKMSWKMGYINPKSNKMDTSLISILLKLDLQHQSKNHGMWM